MKIAHISDTHILTLKRHDEFREVFAQIYKTLRDEKVNYIVHTGDLFHSKLQLTPECVGIAAEFLKSLADIAPTYVIAGNHDTNLRNNKRLDSISPIVDAMDYTDLFYLKNSGPVYLSNVVFNVLSIFDKENWVKFKSEDSKDPIIALYHGAIKGVVTDTGYIIEHGDDDVSIFEGHDYALLGDIHLANQKVDDEGRMRYAGSTIQNNFGEADDKGFLIWDIKDKGAFSVKHHTVKCPKPFATIELDEDGQPVTEPALPKGARIRLLARSNIPVDKVKVATDAIKAKYKPESVTFTNKALSSKDNLEQISNLSKTLNLRDLKVQEELITEFLKDYNLDNSALEKVFDLNSKYAASAEQNEDVARNVTWNVKSLEWDNLFNYGEGNRIDFTKLSGVVGILGKNASGKSSAIDSLLYTIYNTTAKNNRKNLNIINQNAERGHGRVVLDIDGNEYVVDRSSTKYVKKSKGIETTEAKTDVEFTAEAEGLLTGLDRSDTDKVIRRFVGSVDDFLLTSMSSQFNSLAFISEGSTNRKAILAKFLDLDIFETKHKLAKSDASDIKAILKKLEGKDFEAEIKAAQESMNTCNTSILEKKAAASAIERDLREKRDELINLQADIKAIGTQLPNTVELLRKKNRANDAISFHKSLKERAETQLEEIEFKKNNVTLPVAEIQDLLAKKAEFDALTKDLATLERQYQVDQERVKGLEKSTGLLKEVPCGSQFASCKFIKDAHQASGQIDTSSSALVSLNTKICGVEDKIAPLRALKLEENIAKYTSSQALTQKLSLEYVQTKAKIEKYEAELATAQKEFDEATQKIVEAEKHKDTIANFQNLTVLERQLKLDINTIEMSLSSANQEISELYKSSGYYVSTLETLEEQKLELEDCRKQYSAYDLYLKAMHPNGISYQVIKNKLPVINDEINKILGNVVDFQVSLVNEEDKLELLIKHPTYDARPLEMGSGAEKSLASIAIRLALLSVSSLPKPEFFIMDEPGTSLDSDNLAGFIRILELIKGYFKVVFLISHLDILKDAVDMQINIEKRDNYAHISY